MKPLHKYSIPLLATLAVTAGTSLASDDFAENDIAIAFYQITQPAPDWVNGPDTYVVNLGQGSLYRENTKNNVPVSTINPAITSSNIGADLAATFGADWAESGTVYWCVVGGVTQNGPVTNGDPARTNYYSRARASFNTGDLGPGTSINTISSSNRGILTNKVTEFLKDGVNSAILGAPTSSTSGANVSGVIIPTSTRGSLDEFLPNEALTYFGIGIDPRQVLASGPISGTAGLQGALDLYRFIHTTTGADLTVGASSGNAVAGTGQFIGTLTLDSTGNLKIQGVGSAPPVANFSTWATTNNVTGGVNGDSDNDGISNLMEYALALNPAGSDGTPGSFNGSTISFTKRAEAVTNNDVTYAIQE
ncbi:MAG: hypothetical protein EOP87_21375, partial [Verrucomicrobiaceae bacterium]